MTRQSVGLQVMVTAILAGLTYGIGGEARHAAAVFCGGLVSALNGAMLAWRMFRTVSHSAEEAPHPGDPHRLLWQMYFYAAERFLAVVVLLGLCMVLLKGSELAVLGGFTAGQIGFLAARLVWNR